MNNEAPITRSIRGLQSVGVLLAVIGVVIWLALGAGNLTQLYRAYLYGWMFWICMTMGCFGFILLQNSVRGTWGRPTLRIWESGGGPVMIALMAVLFIPVLIGASYLYPWAMPKYANLEVIRYRSGYMNLPFFTVRSYFYFGLFGFVAYFLRRWSLQQDKTGDLALAQWRTNLGSFGMVLYILFISIAFTDWGMSLDVHWFSTIYGLWFVVGSGLQAIAFTTLLLARWAHYEPYAEATQMETLHYTFWRDMGNLLLTLTMLWAYTSLSQWLIIWMGNLPEEVTYYLIRNQGIWLIIGAFLIIGQFFIPFLALLSGKTKATPGWRLTLLSVWILLMRATDVAWIIIPAYFAAEGHLTTGGIAPLIALSYAGAWLFVGGIWLWVFGGQLRSAPLIIMYEYPILEIAENA